MNNSGYHRFPPGGTFDRYGEGLHSWETSLLPYLDNPARPNLELPWNHPENEQHFKKKIGLFLNPTLHGDDVTDSRRLCPEPIRPEHLCRTA
jgi:hypothetical protein